MNAVSVRKKSSGGSESGATHWYLVGSEDATKSARRGGNAAMINAEIVASDGGDEKRSRIRKSLWRLGESRKRVSKDGALIGKLSSAVDSSEDEVWSRTTRQFVLFLGRVDGMRVISDISIVEWMSP